MPAARLEGHVPALLFDRLIAPEPAAHAAGSAQHFYDREALRASIRAQLGWLLNTRVPVEYATLDARTRAGTRTTIDYGLPDLTVYPIGDADAMARLARHLAETIALYEPRLAAPHVELLASPDRSDLLTVRIGGEIAIDATSEAAAFVFEISAEEGARHGG